MSEDKELLAKISQLAGHINRYKNQGNGEIDATTAAFTSTRRHHPYAPPYTNQPARGGPIGRPTLRGRGGRAGRVLPSAHRNRSLVLNTSGTPTNSYEKTTTAPPTPSGDATGESVNSPAVGWVSKIDRHKQLINTSIYETETSRRAKAIEETRKTKARRKDGREKTRIMRSLQSIAVSGTFPGARPTIPDIYISGIRFRPSSDGSKLTKLPDDVNPTRSTPKKVNALDGVYIRSKNGNLYRSGLVKSKQRRTQPQKVNAPCKRFTSTGSCVNGPTCRYIHDPTKVAMCKDYLSTGNCPAGGACDFSHDPTPERVPACVHFLRGNCSNSPCRYAHVRVNPGAPVCRAFASFGFCEKGAQCTERHVHECPNYANTGMCHEKKCRLPHVDRAGQIRKNIANLAAKDDKGEASVIHEEQSSDISSEEEDYDESGSDVDSDDLEEEPMHVFGTTDNQDVARQQDYIRF